jgi:protein involved in polysaccharide export with SLBB domain
MRIPPDEGDAAGQSAKEHAMKFRIAACVRWMVLCALVGWTMGLSPRPAAAAEYKIQADDVLAIKVTNEAGLSQNYTVDEKGEIMLDMVGKVRVAGLTVKETREKLDTELKKYLKVFDVTVDIIGEVGSKILVYGEVAKAGAVKVRQEGTLLDALAAAGQTTEAADRKRVMVTHKDGTSETIDLDVVLTNASKNIRIVPGDTITVPSKVNRSVTVDGEVTKPGTFPLETASTAYAAIRAAAPTTKSDFSRIAVRKKNSSIPVMIDLSRVHSGQLKDDYELQEGDKITVLSKFAGNVNISGEVKNPGEKDLNGKTQLWDFINLQAGGFTEMADRARIQVLREQKSTKTFDLLKVSKGLRRADDPEMELMPGDVIFVPKATATLRGEVKSQGERTLPESCNLWDFINGTTGGGGFTENADRSRVAISRDGKTIRTVNLWEVGDGTKSYDDPQLEILPGDVISVPNDEKMRFAIVGGVKKPGKYTARPGMTLIDALTLCEGTAASATLKTLVLARADRFGPDGKLLTPGAEKGQPGAEKADEGKKRGKKDKDAEELEAQGLIVIDYKQLTKGDPKQNVAILPGDRILVPEEKPKDPSSAGKKPSFLQSIMQMVPLAGMFLGGGIGGYGYRPYGFGY